MSSYPCCPSARVDFHENESCPMTDLLLASACSCPSDGATLVDWAMVHSPAYSSLACPCASAAAMLADWQMVHSPAYSCPAYACASAAAMLADLQMVHSPASAYPACCPCHASLPVASCALRASAFAPPSFFSPLLWPLVSVCSCRACSTCHGLHVEQPRPDPWPTK